MTLSSDIQSVRKLRPFLDAIEALLSIADKANALEKSEAQHEANLAKAKAEMEQAIQASSMAKAESSLLSREASSTVESARATAKSLKEEAEQAATVLIRDAKAAAKLLDDASKAKADVARNKLLSLVSQVTEAEQTLTKINERISEARDLLKRQASF